MAREVLGCKMPLSYRYLISFKFVVKIEFGNQDRRGTSSLP